jgi:rubrerythrin
MSEISRRQFLYLSAVSTLIFPVSALAAHNKADIVYTRTIAVLREAYKSEMTSHKNYIGFASRALSEKYPNIAYLFYSFSCSEKIHADNYKRILAILGHKERPFQMEPEVRDTKANLQKAAAGELLKIETTYPNFIKELEPEACQDAIVHCAYSWKSHKQHDKKVKEIDKYTEIFFGSVSKKIEGLNLDFYICGVCGSTLDKAPASSCVICEKTGANYRQIERPA